MENIPNLPIEQLELPGRVYRCLKSAGMHTVEAVLQAAPDDILKLRNFGSRSLHILKQTLNRRGYDWNPAENRERRELDLAAVLGMNVDQVGFSDGMVERLHLAQIELVGELATKTPDMLLKFPHIGPRGIKIVRQVLNDLGLDLGMDLVCVQPGRWVDRLEFARSILRGQLISPARIYFFAKEHGLSPRMLDRFLSGRPLSPFLISKLRNCFSAIDLTVPFDMNTCAAYQRLSRAYDVYRASGGLKKAASRMRMSHEQVRKLLKLGGRLKLFDYASPRSFTDEGV